MFDETALAAELAGRHGVTTRARLRRLGFTNRMVDGLIGRGSLTTAGNGVVVATSAPSTFEQRVAVACAVTGGVASCPTAGCCGACARRLGLATST